jgi:hypothetical protein
MLVEGGAMAKRASESKLKGSRGQSAVKLMFEDLDWGPVPVPEEHDDGTDFFVQVRDVHRFELGLLLGVQVKNEKRYFSKKARSKARTSGGWAYWASQDDAKYWLEHSVPHILALYDRETGIAYWAHVTVDSVRWTDAGAKIWIPDSQRIDGESRDALLKVAATVKPAATWSGSSLDDISKIAPQSRLRFALLAPRVAAPHLNQPFAELSAEEAIASLMLCRLRELTHYEQEDLIPNEADRSAGTWEWRFFEALRIFVASGALKPLKSILDEAVGPHQRTAARAAYLSSLAEQGEYQAGLDLFTHLDVDEINDPIDRAWLTTHGARCLLERGHKVVSLEAALGASAIGAFYTDDATALTISAAAFTCAFSAADLESKHFEPMMRANDVAPLWWRNQQRAWGLSTEFDQEFEEWAGKDSTGYPKETMAWQHLRSIVLTSGAAGDHQAWRSAAAQLARFELMMKSSQFQDEHYATALRDLRLSGDEKAVILAVKKLGEDGPSHAVAVAGQQLDFLKSTRTSLASDIDLVTAGADLLSDSDADRHAEWAFAMLTDPVRLQPITQSVPWTNRYIVRMLRSLWPRLGRQAMDATRSFLTEMPSVADQLHAVEFARLVHAIGSEGWTEHQISGIRGRLAAVDPLDDGPGEAAVLAGGSESTSDHDEQSLTDAWRWLLSEVGDETHKQQLFREAAEGSYEALLAIGSLDGFPVDVATQIIGHLRDDLAAQRNTAAQGHGVGRKLDEGSTLLKMNLLYPQVADWEPIANLLEGPAFAEQQSATISALTQVPEQIPPAVTAVLVPHLRHIADKPSDERFSFSGLDTQELARRALEALEPELSDPSEIARRLAHGPEAKQTLARTVGLVGTKLHVLLLAALARDDQSIVRAAAAWAATRWVVRDIEPTFAQELVDTLLGERGTRIAREVTLAIPHAEGLTRAVPILRKLGQSDSAAVRERAAELLESRETADVSAQQTSV